MFQDAKEELKRLEQQLLAEEDEPVQEESTEDISSEELEELKQLLESDSEEPMITEDDDFDTVRNFDGQVRNFANNYKAYNSDKTDTDLESYSEEVRYPSKDRSESFLTVLALVRLAGILGILVWWLVRFKGLL